MQISSYRVKKKRNNEYNINSSTSETENLTIENLDEYENGTQYESRNFMVPIQKYRDKSQIGVTTLSRQIWCEKSLELSLEYDVIASSKAIDEGVRHHEILELQDHDIIDVIVETSIEKLGLELLSIANLLEALYERGYVRELPIIGFHKDIMLRGIIDSLKLIHNNNLEMLDSLNFNNYNSKMIQKYEVLITDTKTRRKPSTPSIPQQKTTVFQLGLYKLLLNRMRLAGLEWKNKHSCNINFSESYDLNECCEGCKFLYKLFEFNKVDYMIQFNEINKLEISRNKENKYEDSQNKNIIGDYQDKNIIGDYQDKNIIEDNQDKNIIEDNQDKNIIEDNQDKNIIEDNQDKNIIEDNQDKSTILISEILSNFQNLLHIGFKLMNLLAIMPPIHNNMKVEYDCEGCTFATKWHTCEELTIMTEVDYLLGWWLGLRDSEPVLNSEMWKCKYCNVLEYCNFSPLPKEVIQEYIVQGKQTELDNLLLKDLENAEFF
ncbi:uncharacterized protein CMU_005330 [Cryptosporidium muris RN66]|uniref:Exonuclease V n=1 Tax=Cryptosporidium muris (strain RN66) TaxID=441375 RepID=B6AHB5_CRYMR|nr:uncharacterized protein CMU_005330 [Cryptosporidium muris RN66]EEA07610.1 hypothetical protein, conserved [Cryptosporidium muris RN66]|eukprot:XP_002141959.1 hypothetical protein [Cryptosporidium muris RN66]